MLYRYIVHLLVFSWWHYAIAAGICVLTLLVFRKKPACDRWALALLLAYVYLVIAGTILDRPLQKEPVWHLRPFWSYGSRRQRINIILNLLMFVPVGFLGGALIGWKIIPWAARFSFGIEIVQLVTWRGSYDVDDLINNTASAILGFLLFLLFRRITKKPDPCVLTPE